MCYNCLGYEISCVILSMTLYFPSLSLMEDSDHEMEEYIFSGSDDELDAEVLEELDAREMEDMLVGANVILGNDTDYSSDNDNDSYVGDYESKKGGNDSDKESNADDRNYSDRESITCSDMNFRSSEKDILVVEVVVVIEVTEVVGVMVEVMVEDVIELIVEGGAKVKPIAATMMFIYNGLTKLQMSPFNHSLVYQDKQ